MTTTNKTIKAGKGNASDLPKIRKIKTSFNALKAFALREKIINSMANYCAELSQVLLVDFAENIAMEWVELPMTAELYELLTAYQDQIDKVGLPAAGHQILLNMRATIQD